MIPSQRRKHTSNELLDLRRFVRVGIEHEDAVPMNLEVPKSWLTGCFVGL
jgi:hypothetical protein